MKKRILSCLMALALCLTLLPTAALAEETEGTAQTPPAMEEAADPANGEAKQENQPAEVKQESQPAEAKQESQPAEAKQESQPAEAKQENQPVEAKQESQPAEVKQESQPAEQEEQQEDSAAKQAVANVQALIDALPDAETLDGMDDAEAMEVYEAFQTACEAYYDTLTEEQQAQLKNTEKLEALSERFSQLETLAAGDTHTHFLCGGADCNEKGHKKEEIATTFNMWLASSVYNKLDVGGPDHSVDGDGQELVGGKYYVLTDGNYYLKKGKDVKIEHPIQITGIVTICLNGQTIESSAQDMPVFEIVTGGKLTLTDCGSAGKVTHFFDGTGCGVEVNGGEFNLYGGSIIGNTAAKNSEGGGVRVCNGTFNMYGGSITGNNAKVSGNEGKGGGVRVGSYDGKKGAFNLYGGEISDNEAKYGGGVDAFAGEFNMYGGEITNNKATSIGGGVYVDTESCTFNMSGGEIKDNTASNGGGVSIDTGTFNMSGGSITGNTASNGGGVYKLYGTFTVSSKAVIKDNKKGTANNSADNNVYLPNSTVITVSGHLDNGASIGVTTKSEPAAGGSVIAIGKDLTDKDAEKFKSDLGGYAVSVNEEQNRLVLVKTHTHCICGNSSCNEDSHGAAVTFATVLTQALLEQNSYTLSGGTYYLNGTLSPVNKIEITGTVTICLNGHTIESTAEGKPVFEIVSSGTLTLTNCGSRGEVTSAYNGGGVEVNGGTFNLYGGSITKNTAANGGGVYVYNRGEFNMYGGTITNNTATKGGGGVYVSGGTFNLYGGEIAYNKSEGANSIGGGVYVYGGTFTMSGGTISRNTANSANGADGGVGVYNDAKFIMNGGTISGNQTKGQGGGVGVHNRGTFTMNGGTIGGTNDGSKANTANYGGGVNVGNNGQFTMTGGEISGNKATENGGGVYVNSGNIYTFTMTDGTISGNTANYGGGVYVNSGTFNMTDGTIGGATEGAANTAKHGGGGVYVKDGKFVMNGPTTSVSGNTATENGGGVYVEGGTFTMNDGTIGGGEGAANTADQGGGVYVSSGTFTMSGGSITGNDGNGVYVHNIDNATFTVSGAPTVMRNTRGGAASNVYLAGDNKTITIGKAGLTDGASIGVIKTRLLYVGDAIATGANKDYSRNFSIDDNTQYKVGYDKAHNQLVLAEKDTTAETHTHCLCGKTHTAIGDHKTEQKVTFATELKMENGKLMKGGREWIKSMVNRADGGREQRGYVLSQGEYYLYGDITLSDAAILINGDVKLCLNGHTIDRANKTGGSDYVIWVLGNDKAHLTLTDCIGGGTIKGGGNGGVDIFGFCTLDMFGGTITGNTNRGVGVGQFGEFNMYGGKITGNSAGFGGGVYNGGTVNMYGGEIRGNTASNKGGGVYMEASMGNYQGGILNVSGAAKITDNTVKGVANNVYLPSGKTITIGGALTGEAGSIGVTTEPKPAAGTPVTVIADTTGISGLTTHVVSDDNAYATAVEGSTIVLKVKGDTTGGNIPVTQITLNTTTASLEVGKTTTLTATVEPSDATNKSVTWTSSDTSVATVAPDGTVTAVKAGTATITATAEGDNSKFATCTVTVTGGTTPSQPGGSTGGNTGGSSSGGGGGSSSGGSDSNPVIKTETKNNADGSTTKTETRRDGSVTQTTTGKDGSVSKTETKPNGSSVTENKAADGSTGTVKTDKNGQTEAETKVSAKAVEDAKKNGEAVKAPVEVEASRNSGTAPTVKVELPKGAGETKVEIPVSNVKPGTVAVLVHPDGTEEILKNSIPTEDGIQLTVDGNATVKIVDNSKGFIDTRNHWAEDAIDFVSARGLVNGMSATIYAPNNSTTRAQLWTILARQNDANLNGGSVWYEKAQNWAKDKGVSDGANPNAAINRAQMVTMLWRAVGQPAAGGAATFTDVSADAYYAGAVSWAVENGITTGVGGGKFDPTGACTRAQIAAFLTRLYAEK